jgi:hypothetical protein
MPKPDLTKLAVRSLDDLGYWLCDDRRYYRYAILCLRDLEIATNEVKSIWPGSPGQVARDADVTPELTLKARRRDLLSDSVKVFSAMAVEGFINFYGAVRLGGNNYLNHLEFAPLPMKVEALLKHCDGISLSVNDRLLVLGRRIAKRRNALVHPRASETGAYVPAKGRLGDRIPDVARESVQDMVSFFTEFSRLVPAAAHLVPPIEEA